MHGRPWPKTDSWYDGDNQDKQFVAQCPPRTHSVDSSDRFLEFDDPSQERYRVFGFRDVPSRDRRDPSIRCSCRFEHSVSQARDTPPPTCQASPIGSGFATYRSTTEMADGFCMILKLFDCVHHITVWLWMDCGGGFQMEGKEQINGGARGVPASQLHIPIIRTQGSSRHWRVRRVIYCWSSCHPHTIIAYN